MPEVERPKALQGRKANRAFIKGHGCPKLNAQRLCKDAKPTERSIKGKGVGGFVRVGVGRVMTM